jgi:hypothetical protein
VVGVVCLLVLAPVAVAAGGGWSGQASDDPYGQGSALYGVSCSAPSACTAVGIWEGPGAMAERWDGSHWSDQSTPSTAAEEYSHLNGVSCPSARECIAVGSGSGSASQGVTLAERWDGSNWTVMNTPSHPLAELNSISCPTVNACTAVGEHGSDSNIYRAVAERWNGSTWTLQSIPKPDNALHYLDLSSVSCASAKACIAVGSYGPDRVNPSLGYIVALRWNGRRWSVQHTAGSGRGALFGVSCPSARWCVAVGDKRNKALVERWNGRRWSIMTAPYSAGYPIAVSCTSASACTAVGETTHAQRWNGKRWSVQRPFDRQDIFDGVSCPSASDCTAVGETYGGSYSLTVIEHWTG